MLTIKQLQTFYWVAKLGTIHRAADKLCVTQSAASKRLHEVEASVSVPLFEGGGKKNLLTVAGRELLGECEKLFGLLSRLDALKGDENQVARTLHVGLTEVTALTWFSEFLIQLQALYPALTVQPHLDQSEALAQKIMDGSLDIAFVSTIDDDDAPEPLAFVPVGHIQFCWMAKAGTFDPDIIHPYVDLMAHRLIQQSPGSIISRLCEQVSEVVGAQPETLFGGNNTVAIGGLIAAGVGISCLPVALFRREIDDRRIQALSTAPMPAKVTCSACFLKQSSSRLGVNVSEVAKSACAKYFSREQGAR